MTVMGGLTVLEAILLAIWITLNVVMLWNWYYYYTESYDYGESTQLHKTRIRSKSMSNPMSKCQLHVEHHAKAVQRRTLTHCMLLLPLTLDSRCITITQHHRNCKQAFSFVFP